MTNPLPNEAHASNSRRSWSRRIAALAGGVALCVTTLIAPSGTAFAGHWRDGTSPNSCSSSQTVRSAHLGYGPQNQYRLGRVQLRFSDPCDIVWTRVCVGSAITNGRVGTKYARRGANYVPGLGTYTANGTAGTDSTQPACGSTYYKSAKWTHGVFTDCSEDYGSSCPTWGFGSVDGFYQGTYEYDSAQTSNF